MRSKYALWFGGVLGFLLVAGMLISYTVYLNSKKSNPPHFNPMLNNDQAHRQIDFDSLLHQQGDFTYIKATQGAYFINAQLHQEYAKAKEEHIPVGFYHIYEMNNSAAVQAQHFLSTVHGKPTRLPLLVDLSVLEKIEEGTATQAMDRIKEFMLLVEKHKGSQIMIYSNERLYHQFIKGNFDTYDVWICSMGLTPKAHVAFGQNLTKTQDHSCWLKPNSFATSQE